MHPDDAGDHRLASSASIVRAPGGTVTLRGRADRGNLAIANDDRLVRFGCGASTIDERRVRESDDRLAAR